MFFNNHCNIPRECCCKREEKPNFFCKKRVVEVVDIFKIEKVGMRCPKEHERDKCKDIDDIDCGCDRDKDRKGNCGHFDGCNDIC